MDKWLGMLLIAVALGGPLTTWALNAFKSDEERKADAYKECLEAAEKHKGNSEDCKELLKK